MYQLEDIRGLFTKYNIEIFGATTSGELANASVYEESIVVMLLDIPSDAFALNVFDAQNLTSYQAGQRVAEWATSMYSKPAFLVMSAGLHADGEQVVHGLIDTLEYQAPIFGGLAVSDLSGFRVFPADGDPRFPLGGVT